MIRILTAISIAAVAAAAQEGKLTPLMTQDLNGLPGKEATMVMCPADRRPSTGTMLTNLFMCWKAPL